MNAQSGKKIIFNFSFAILYLSGSVLSFAGTANEHFQFPHFFAQSPDNTNNYILRFSKGQMLFADRQIYFRVIKSKPIEHDHTGPDEIMQADDAIAESIT